MKNDDEDKFTVYPVNYNKPYQNLGDMLHTDTPELCPTGNEPVHYKTGANRKGVATWRSREWETVPYLFKIKPGRKLRGTHWNFRHHDPVEPNFYFEQAEIIAEIKWSANSGAADVHEYILLPPPNTIRLMVNPAKNLKGEEPPRIVSHHTLNVPIGALFQLISPAFAMEMPLSIKPFCTRPSPHWAVWFCIQCGGVVSTNAPIKCAMVIGNCELQIGTRWEVLYGAE